MSPEVLLNQGRASFFLEVTNALLHVVPVAMVGLRLLQADDVKPPSRGAAATSVARRSGTALESGGRGGVAEEVPAVASDVAEDDDPAVGLGARLAEKLDPAAFMRW